MKYLFLSLGSSFPGTGTGLFFGGSGVYGVAVLYGVIDARMPITLCMLCHGTGLSLPE